jgi:hypothetical protein
MPGENVFLTYKANRHFRLSNIEPIGNLEPMYVAWSRWEASREKWSQ